MQKMLKVGNKRVTAVCDTCSKFLIGTQRQRHIYIYFHFEQHLIIPVVSLSLTFNKYTASIYNQSE